ncbi:MAG: RNA polymerase sigma factor [Cyclobacteriaceae bacterium]|nr:RNA polymerase sigma factor [Cyclobacteriaceae bacterium]
MTDKAQNEIFKEWLDSYKALLFKIVRAYTFTEDERDDLFQEISIQIWRSIPNFRNESTVTTWIYRIALNTSIKWRSKEQKVIIGNGLNYQMVMTKTDETDERVEWLYEQISKLNEIDRSLCLLLLDDFSYKEMGDMLGITEGNVAVKIHRIKKYFTEQSKNNLT